MCRYNETLCELSLLRSLERINPCFFACPASNVMLEGHTKGKIKSQGQNLTVQHSTAISNPHHTLCIKYPPCTPAIPYPHPAISWAICAYLIKMLKRPS